MDFCAIFEREMNGLYSLAFLLAGDHETAGQCFLGALEDCRKESDVFREWARPWCRRAVVKQAIRRVQPRSGEREVAARAKHSPDDAEDIPRRLLRLPSFERFVFAMAVLERYSARECAVLLDCQVRDVEQARIRALRFLGQEAGRDRRMAVLAGRRGQEPLAAASA